MRQTDGQPAPGLSFSTALKALTEAPNLHNTGQRMKALQAPDDDRRSQTFICFTLVQAYPFWGGSTTVPPCFPAASQLFLRPPPPNPLTSLVTRTHGTQYYCCFLRAKSRAVFLKGHFEYFGRVAGVFSEHEQNECSLNIGYEQCEIVAP